MMRSRLRRTCPRDAAAPAFGIASLHPEEIGGTRMLARSAPRSIAVSIALGSHGVAARAASNQG
jgi:hypothetical protein